jgi:hypothetical protein
MTSLKQKLYFGSGKGMAIMYRTPGLSITQKYSNGEEK